MGEDSIEVKIMPRRYVPGILSVILFVFCFVFSAAAQLIPPGPSDTGLGGSNSITGMVLVGGGQRLERSVAVRLKSMTKGDRVVMTDDYGKFAFRGLGPGDYTIAIEREKDFEPLSQSVTITQMPGGSPGTYNVSLRLKQKDGTNAKPAVVNSEFANVPKECFGSL